MRGRKRAWLTLVAAGCARSAAPAPLPVAPVAVPAPSLPRAAPTLALEDRAAGRLVFDRHGGAWELACDGTALTRRPWEGGAWLPAGPCDRQDPVMPSTSKYIDSRGPIAVDGDVVVSALDRPRRVVVSRAGKLEREIALPESVWVAGAAIDGAALVLVVHRFGDPRPGDQIEGTPLPTELAALVRIDDRVTVKQLVAYGSTKRGMNPHHVAMGPRAIILADNIGEVQVCDYQLACGELTSSAALDDLAGSHATADGSLVVFHFGGDVSRLDERGAIAWTAPASAYDLIGSTTTEVWVQTSGPEVVTLDLATGAVLRTAATTRSARREEWGRYLVLSGVAATPAGTVVRGAFGGTLRAGELVLSMPWQQAICWWENPHNAHQSYIPFDGTCDERHAKAIETGRRWFVATGAEAFAQTVDDQRLSAPR